MRNFLVVAAALFLIVAAFARPAAAVQFQGQLLDGRFLRATVFGPFGAQPASVFFTGDRARVTTSDGNIIIMHVRDEEITDPSFVGAIGLDGMAYRLQLDPTQVTFGASVFDSSMTPRGPHGGNY
jgi:hypothetical protein